MPVDCGCEPGMLCAGCQSAYLDWCVTQQIEPEFPEGIWWENRE